MSITLNGFVLIKFCFVTMKKSFPMSYTMSHINSIHNILIILIIMVALMSLCIYMLGRLQESSFSCNLFLRLLLFHKDLSVPSEGPLKRLEVKVSDGANQPCLCDWFLIKSVDIKAQLSFFGWQLFYVYFHMCRRRRGHQKMSGITDAMDINLGRLWEMVRDREAWSAAAHGVTKSWTWLGNGTTQLPYIVATGNRCCCITPLGEDSWDPYPGLSLTLSYASLPLSDFNL